MNKNMLEIERKFLVKPSAIENYSSRISLTQGYLMKNEFGSVRIRIEQTVNLTSVPRAYLMSKTKVDDMSNYETVDEISVENAKRLIDTFCSRVIRKLRHIVIVDGKKWEIDLFKSPNEGLLLAELELESVDETFTLPDWIEREVTGEAAYYNANM
jgi:adenylate cyclase